MSCSLLLHYTFILFPRFFLLLFLSYSVITDFGVQVIYKEGERCPKVICSSVSFSTSLLSFYFTSYCILFLLFVFPFLLTY